MHDNDPAGVKRTDTAGGTPCDNETHHPNPDICLFSRAPFFSQVLEVLLGLPQDSIKATDDVLSFSVELQESSSDVFVLSDHINEAVELCEEALISNPNRGVILFTLNEPELYPDDLQTLFSEGAVLHCRLPCSLETLGQINTRLAEPRKQDWPSKIKEKIREIAARRSNDYDAWQRHRTGNLMAAVRLFNGALRSRAYDLTNDDMYTWAETAYQALLNSDESWDDSRKNEEFIKASGTIRKAINEIRLNGCESGLWHEQLNRILVVDDQENMWRPVWEFIFGNNKLVMYSDGEGALRYIEKHGAEIDCMLLDLYLGEGKPNGLELLPQIKALQLDLPVVVMTAYDDSQVAREAYRRGAGFCFVKERRDQEDRNPIDYFNMLKNIINSLPLANAEERVLWRKFAKIEGSFDKNGSLLSEIGERLRKAFFFLLLDTEEVRARLFLTGDAKEDWHRCQFVIHFACNAFEIFLDRTVTTKPEVALTVTKKFPIWLLDTLRTREEKTLELPKNIEKYGGSGHHPRSNELPKYTPEHATNLLDSIVEWFKTYFSFNKIATCKAVAVPVQPPCSLLPWLETLEQRMATKERESQRNDVSSHEKRGKSGALRLLQGALMECGGEESLDQETIYDETENVDSLIQYHEEMVLDLMIRRDNVKYVCLFVDDQGIASGWKRVLDLLLPMACVQYLEFTKDSNIEDVYEKAKTVDFIILDLKLPSPSGWPSEEVGLKVLKEFWRRLPYLPVTVLTASDDAYYFRKVIQAGAFDCFPKTHQSSFGVDNSAYFLTYWNRFKDIIELLIKHLEHTQPISRAIQGMDSLNPFLMFKVIPIENRLIDLPPPRKEILHVRASERLMDSLKTAYFLLTRHQNLGLQCLLDRLYFSEAAKRYHKSAEFEAFTQAMKGAEYCCQILAGLSNPKSVFYSGSSKPLPLGDLLIGVKKDRSDFWKEYLQCLGSLKRLWQVRNRIEYKNTGNVRFEKLVLKAIRRVQELTEAIAVKSREHLLKNMPQKLPKNMQFVPEILVLNISTERRFESFLAEIYECIFLEKKGGLLEWVAEEWFRLIIAHYLKRELELPKDDKNPDLVPNLDQFSRNLTIRKKSFLRSNNAQKLEEEAGMYEKEMAAIEAEMDEKRARLYEGGSKVPYNLENAIESKYIPKKEEIASKLSETKSMLDQLMEQKMEAEGITIIELLNQREEILNSWYEKRSQWMEKQRDRDNLRTYLTWPGFVPFNDFCDFCVKYLISKNGEGRQRLTKVVRSFPEFMFELRGAEGHKALEMIFSKTMECLKALDTMPLEYSVNGELVPQEICMVFEMSGNCIEIDTDILPEDRNQGPYTLRMESDDNNMLKTYLEPQNEGGNLRL